MKTDIGSLENAKYNRMVGLNVEIITDCTKYIDYIKATYSTNYLKAFKRGDNEIKRSRKDIKSEWI